MRDETMMKRKMASLQFALWELHLFLDTHPNDCEAAQKMREYQTKLELLKKEYTEKYGPLNETPKEASRWAWISEPWPWEVEEEE